MRIHHVALRVADCEASLAFYSGLLGLAEVRRSSREGAVVSVWLKAADTILMIERALRGEGREAGSGHVLAFAVDDLQAWEARLGHAGVAIVDRTPQTVYVADPDGHRVGLTVFETSSR